VGDVRRCHDREWGCCEGGGAPLLRISIAMGQKRAPHAPYHATEKYRRKNNQAVKKEEEDEDRIAVQCKDAGDGF
jgi:hypothetical protein